MALIDIGYGAEDGPYAIGGGKTSIDRTNLANASGTLDTFEVWLKTSSGTSSKMGTFSGSPLTYTSRDYETLGAVSSGSKQKFTGLNCDVEIGDYIGGYFRYGGGGALEADRSGGLGSDYYSGDAFTGRPVVFSILTSDGWVALYGTGTTGAEEGIIPVNAYYFQNIMR